MSYFTADSTAQLIQPDPDAQFLFVNNDTVNPVYISQSKGVNRQSDKIPAQGSVSLTGWWYASSLDQATTIECFVFGGGSQWSNPVGVQIALNALGLAKDSSVNAPAYGPATSVDVVTNAPANITGGKKLADVNATLGTPAQTADISAVRTTLGTPAQTVDVVTTGPAAITGGKKLSDVNATLGTPAQDATVSGLSTGIPNGIAVTGVPLLTKSTLVKNQGAISQAPGTQSNSATFSIQQIGYEIFLSVFAATNIAAYYRISLQWFDSGTGIQTGQEDYWIIPGPGSGSPHTIIGHGPTKGDQLVIVSENPAQSVGNNVTHSYVVLENSRDYQSDQWESLTFAGANITNTFADIFTGCIASTNTSIGATSSVTRLLPLYNGLVTVVFSTTSGLTDGVLNIQQVADQSNGGALPNQTVLFGQTGSNGQLYVVNVALPSSQCQAVLTNNNAATKTFGLSVIQQKQLVAA